MFRAILIEKTAEGNCAALTPLGEGFHRQRHSDRGGLLDGRVTGRLVVEVGG